MLENKPPFLTWNLCVCMNMMIKLDHKFIQSWAYVFFETTLVWMLVSWPQQENNHQNKAFHY